MAAYDFLEDKVYKVKRFEKFGVAKDGAFMIACFIKLKASCSEFPHLNKEFFFIMD